MKGGLIDRIRAIGHWRVVFRPARPLHQQLSFAECEQVVERNRVTLRGWDFPHISRRKDDGAGYGREDGFAENWCDWIHSVEFWRMYRSGQFVSYRSLEQDLDGTQTEDQRYLDVRDAIYSVSEFIEFAHRIAKDGLYRDGYEAEVSLVNTKGRFLQVGPGRMPFLDPRRTNLDTISLKTEVTPSQIHESAPATSLPLIIELFSNFGWDPASAQIGIDQEKFYRREFS